MHAQTLHELVIKNLNMETIITQKAPSQALAKTLAYRLNAASQQAVLAQEQVVQLAWDLGDVLQTEKSERPDTFAAFCEGAGIAEGMAKHAVKVRNITEERSEVTQPNNMRQALFELLVPAKEHGEERIELAPPQSWRKWVNAARVWSRRLRIGLATVELEAFVRETDGVYEVLTEARQKLQKEGKR
jgi:PIN domain nuclease of toxin-antitoxin system